jgi:hypothetical protein
MSVKRLLSKAAYAKDVGVSRQAVTKACNSVLKEALFDGKVDYDHPSSQEYRKEQEKKQAKKKSKEVDKNVNQVDKPTPSKKIEDLVPESEPEVIKVQTAITSELSTEDALKEVEGLTIKQLIARYGTASQFKEFLIAHKTIEAINSQMFLRAEKEKELIPKELVETFIFGAIEDVNMKLLMDAPKTILRRVIAHLKSGEDVEMGEDLIRSIISDQLKVLPSRIRKSLNNV